MKKAKVVRVPRTLKAARAAGFQTAALTNQMIASMPKNLAISVSDNVPVGHLWHLGQPDNTTDTVMACYKKKDGTCHWVEVPLHDPPEWDPAPV